MADAATNRGQVLRHRRTGRLAGKAALVVGGDAGIGRAVATAFAKAGADVAIIYLNDHRGAEELQRTIRRESVRCLLLAGSVTSEAFCRNAVQRALSEFGRLDVLVNNVAEQRAEEMRDPTLPTDMLGMFYVTKAAAPHLPAGGRIINTTAVMAWRDRTCLIVDDATTGTVVSFTRSLARALGDRRIRVNAVTPDPEGMTLGGNPRREQAPALEALAASYVFLAAGDDSFMTGRVLHARVHDAAA